MRRLIGLWCLFVARPSWADEALEAEIEPTRDGVWVADASVAPATTVESALPSAPSPSAAQGFAPPLCTSRSARCLSFATTPAAGEPWDGRQLERDISGPAGLWRKKRRR